jgi:hypothetical protein
MAGAATAGLARAQALIAQQVAPADETLARLATEARPDPTEVRRALLLAVRGADGE